MINAIKNYMILPSEMSEFEQNYLARMNSIGLKFFYLHLPVLVTIAFLNDTGPLLAAALTALTCAGPYIASKCWDSKRAVSTVLGITAMFMGGLLVHFGQGPVQIEMHFYFFVLIALLAVFANPMVVVAAAVTAALHHTVLWVMLPASIFNYEAPFWVVAIHAAFVVLESVAACFIARSFFDNVIGLEKIVGLRTAEVDKRNNDMRRILNSVRQGFFTIDLEGNISEERSAAVEKLLGPIGESETLIDVLRRHSDHAADWYELGLEDVVADLMPLDVVLDQLPSRVVADGKTISVASRAIHDGEQLTGLAIVLTDISAEIEREKLEEESREMVAIVEHCSRDENGFLDFYQECSALIDQLLDLDIRGTRDITLIKRQIHTLKGNSAIFGLSRLSRACHVVEDFIEENGSLPDEAAWQGVRDAWDTASENMVKLIGEPSDGLEVAQASVEKILSGLLNDNSREEMAIEIASWYLEPTKLPLQRISTQVKSLAERLGKGGVEVSMKDNTLRLDSAEWSGFWSSFIHVIRNAVDHGIESSAEREEQGKLPSGQISIATSIANQKFEISISDDGRGIDWDRVTEVAYKKGLAAETQEDLVEALFADGVSTADEVTETSGRGVGMAAIREECKKRDGQIKVESVAGEGTVFRFQFPVKTMAPSILRRLSKKEIAKPERTLCDLSDPACRELVSK
jgi:HPt (histidine-containing phosphotransfer) domain-containing protein/two-component sensor histidine kinase